jgi:hypothetical protein
MLVFLLGVPLAWALLLFRGPGPVPSAAGGDDGVVERASGSLKTCPAVAEATGGSCLRTIVGQPRRNLFEQRGEPLSLVLGERGEQGGEHLGASLEQLPEGAVSSGCDMEGVGAPIASRPPLEEALVYEALHDLRRTGLRDPEHAVERLGRFPRVGREMHERSGRGASETQRVFDGGASAVRCGEDGDAKEVGQPVVG